MRVKFTAGRVSSFVCPAGKAQAFMWDAEIAGLGLKASPGGSKKYILESRLQSGRNIRITIGDLSTWSIDAARSEARRLQTLIDKGIDPRTEKKDRLAAAEEERVSELRKDATVSDAWQVYVDARKRNWSIRHAADHERIANLGGQPRKRGKGTIEPGPLAALMPLRLVELTPDKVKEWLGEEATKRPTYAALAYRLLRAFIRWCSDRPEYENIADGKAVGSRVSKDHLPKVRAKEGDCLQREQLSVWFKAVRSLSNVVLSAYLQGLILTGARREELAGLKWEDVDFQWQSITIHDKVEGERTIPLTPYMAHLLRDLLRRNVTPPKMRKLKKTEAQDEDEKKWQPSPYVFASRNAAIGRITEPRVAHNRALAAAGLPHLSIHGLRRSFGTLSEWVECPVGVVAQIQGHKPSAIAEKHYRRRPLDLLRMWHCRIESWILQEAGIKMEQPPSLQAVTADSL